MRTAGNRVALLLAAVLASGSALLTAGAASAQQQAITATVNGAKIQKVGFRAMIQKETIMYNLRRFRPEQTGRGGGRRSDGADRGEDGRAASAASWKRRVNCRVVIGLLAP